MAQPIPAREGDPGSDSCDRTGAEGLSGGNWMVVRVAPGTPGRQWPAGRSSRPFLIFELSPPSGGVGPRRVGFGTPPRALDVRYLVDSASSHMLVSKIKPCMSKYKQLVL
ncbi:hypothetical protein N7493_009322 [Penicillium malachiteum]|nr:hypothetical protein N7493_009322 [Penicillium malachiteum]